jgi:hypothetical protein
MPMPAFVWRRRGGRDPPSERRRHVHRRQQTDSRLLGSGFTGTAQPHEPTANVPRFTEAGEDANAQRSLLALKRPPGKSQSRSLLAGYGRHDADGSNWSFLTHLGHEHPSFAVMHNAPRSTMCCRRRRGCGGPEHRRQLCEKQGDKLTDHIGYMPLSSNADHSQSEPFCLTRPHRTPSEPPTLKAAGLTPSAWRLFHCLDDSDRLFSSV